MLEVVSLATRNRYARFDASQFARKFQLGESHESRSKKLKKIGRTWPREPRFTNRGTRFDFGGHEFLATVRDLTTRANTFRRTTSSARARPKNSSFNSTLYHRLCTHSRRISLFFDHCLPGLRIVREINRVYNVAFLWRNSICISRQESYLSPWSLSTENDVTTGFNEPSNRPIIVCFLSIWTTSFVPTDRWNVLRSSFLDIARS